METASTITELLEPLKAEESRSIVRFQVGADPTLSPAELLHPMLFAPDFDRGEYDRPALPTTVEQVAAVLRELQVTAAQMIPFLTQTCTAPLPWSAMPQGPWTTQTAHEVLKRVTQTLGPRTHWWTNVTYDTWCWAHGDFDVSFTSTPVTGHTFDRAVIGIGTDATVTLLAFADD